MFKYLKLILIGPVAIGYARANQALLVTCQTKGHIVYSSCIVTPPTTAEQTAYCEGVYAAYKGCLTTINSPRELGLSSNKSPYSSSSYDICKYEPAYLVMFDLCH